MDDNIEWLTLMDDEISYLMRYENIDFVTAVERLAAQVGYAGRPSATVIPFPRK